MAQKFLSPGVFTTEVDQSFLAQGVAGVGAAAIGRTLRGPAFRPTLVAGFDDFALRFGATDPAYQMPYAAKNYLRNSSAMTALRVLGHADGTSVLNGYTLGSIVGIVDALPSASLYGNVLASVHTAVAASGVLVTPVAGDPNRFVFKINGPSSVLFAATASFLTSSADYVEKVLNTDPTKWGTYYHYVHATYKYAVPATASAWAAVAVSGALSGFQRDCTYGSTAYVKSQPLGGLEFNLFRFHTIGDGRATNDDIKVEISNVKPSPSPLATQYGTFDVRVRRFYDTDQRIEAVETFAGCSMDPNSKSYVARRIGDMLEYFDSTARKFVSQGTYPNQSRLVRVEMVTDQNAPKEALPWGHRGYYSVSYVSGAYVPDFAYVRDQIDRNGNYDPNVRWGISYMSGGIVDRMRSDPDGASALLVQDADFSLALLTGSYTNGIRRYSYQANLAASDYHQPVYASASMYGFSVPFAGGFDGWDLRLSDPLYISNNADESSASGYAAGQGGGHAVVSLKRAVDCLANPDSVDINLLAMPGIHNLKATDYARTMVNNRADVMFIMDVTGSSVAEVIGNMRNREVDDNYCAAYYPDLKLNDKSSARIIRVAPSVAVLGAIAFSDRVGQVFFAPAGLNRGGLGQFDIIDVADRLDFKDRDDLYDNRLNPIASFPSEGIVVFGQKTLQIKASALDRINIRRLLIYSKKVISSAAKGLLFEPDNPATWQRFTNAVNPILERVRRDQGLERFKVVMDTTTNTPDVIERNVMVGKIFLQPTRSSEFIDLSFIITNAGVEFGE